MPSLKFKHVIKDAPSHPNPGVVYGARITGWRVVRGELVAVWTIFTRRQRKAKLYHITKKGKKIRALPDKEGVIKKVGQTPTKDK